MRDIKQQIIFYEEVLSGDYIEKMKYYLNPDRMKDPEMYDLIIWGGEMPDKLDVFNEQDDTVSVDSMIMDEIKPGLSIESETRKKIAFADYIKCKVNFVTLKIIDAIEKELLKYKTFDEAEYGLHSAKNVIDPLIARINEKQDTSGYQLKDVVIESLNKIANSLKTIQVEAVEPSHIPNENNDEGRYKLKCVFGSPPKKNISDAFKLLVKGDFITEPEKEERFIFIFSGEPFDQFEQKIIWVGVRALHYFMDSLCNRENTSGKKIFTPVPSKWVFTNNVFRKPGGEDFEKIETKNHPPGEKNQKKLVDIVNLLCQDKG